MADAADAGGADRSRTRRRRSRSSTRPGSRRRWCGRPACCGRTSTTGRRRPRRSSRSSISAPDPFWTRRRRRISCRPRSGGTAAVEPVISAEEREAATLLVEPVPPPPGTRPGFGGGGGGRGPTTGPSLPDEFNAEFGLLIGKKMTALQIRDFLSGEFTPLPDGGRHGGPAGKRKGGLREDHHEARRGQSRRRSGSRYFFASAFGLISCFTGTAHPPLPLQSFLP